jgi:hypothetical protein
MKFPSLPAIAAYPSLPLRAAIVERAVPFERGGVKFEGLDVLKKDERTDTTQLAEIFGEP